MGGSIDNNIELDGVFHNTENKSAGEIGKTGGNRPFLPDIRSKPVNFSVSMTEKGF